MKHHRSLLLLFATYPCPATLIAQDAPAEPRALLAAYMDAEVQAHQFQGAVLVVRDGEPLLRSAYGPANAELEVLNTPETRFRLGSITKPFTAMAVLLLRDQGKFDLDDSIGKHLKDAPKHWNNVTIRHLLTHTSGIPSFTGFTDYPKRMHEPTSVADMIGRFHDHPLEFTPGGKFAYSNSGYFLLGALIEEVSGQSYEQFLSESVLTPLGLENTGYDRLQSNIPHRASGHVRRPDGTLGNAMFIDMSIPFSAGALYSTVDDLAHLDQALRTGALLSPESHAEMIRPERNQYGLGWFLGNRAGHAHIGHGGGINGFATAFDRYPEDKLCVVVLSNLENSQVEPIAENLAKIAFGEKVDLPRVRTAISVAPEILDKYVGRYRLMPTMTFDVRRDGDHLVGEPSGQPAVPLFAESESLFYPKVVDATIEFVANDQGEIDALILRQSGREIRAPRVNDSPDQSKAP